jgi:glycosyltransferase involved in cell wall biosynthesis
MSSEAGLEMGKITASNDVLLDISFVVPCLNEEQSIGTVIKEIKRSFDAKTYSYEIIVADNGSIDRSRDIASDNGARIVLVDKKGYGSALREGFREARGKYIVMGDADGSYHFEDAIGMVALLNQDFDFVVGNRFAGKIEKGAMPILHKFIGNPLLSRLGKFLFKVNISDFHCGLRAFRTEKINQLKFRSTGMEFASEIIVEAKRNSLRITELPITLHKDLRNGPSHLNSFPDGWRHLKYLLALSPKYLFLIPGFFFLFSSTFFLILNLLQTISFNQINFSFGSGILFLCFALVSLTLFWSFYIVSLVLDENESNIKKFKYLNPEIIFVLSFFFIILGIAIISVLLVMWRSASFKDLNQNQVISYMLTSLFLISTGIISLSFNFLREIVKVFR